MLSKILGVVALLVSANAMAGYYDSKYLSSCRATVTLSESSNGNINMVFSGLDYNRCNDLTVSDYSTGREIKSYTIKGNSYTLTQNMVQSLSEDCRLGFTIQGYNGKDSVVFKIPNCRPASRYKKQNNGYTYQWSKQHNCKIIDGDQFMGHVEDNFCANATNSTSDVVSYQWSEAGNCKVMVNGRHTKNTTDYFCEVRH